MLPRKQRLSKSRDIEETLKARQHIIRGPLLHLIARENGLQNSRLAVAASKKIGKAVKRNRVRRLIFEAFSQVRSSVMKNIDVVVYPKPAAVGRSLASIRSIIEQFLDKAGLLKNDQAC